MNKKAQKVTKMETNLQAVKLTVHEDLVTKHPFPFPLPNSASTQYKAWQRSIMPMLNAGRIGQWKEEGRSSDQVFMNY